MTLAERIESELKKRQSPARYRHSLAVSGLAADLGERHGWPAERARVAGLVHDWAKEWSPKELIAYVRRRRLRVPGLAFIVENGPNMLHAYVSADVARRNGWLARAEDVAAVSAHTLGAPRMGRAAKILYVADLASPDRRFSEAADVRRRAMADLNGAFGAAVAIKMEDRLRKRKAIHPMAVSVWNRVVCGSRA